MEVSSVSPINSNKNNRPVINARNTGYVASVGFGLTMLSGVTKNNFLRKNHKIFAGISLIAMIAHILKVSGPHKQK